jgi:hypothetical protein
LIRKALVAALLCCACKDSVIPVGTIRGTYALTTIDGVSLPYTVPGTTGPTTVIVADSITLMENSIFHQAGTQRVTGPGGTTTSPTSNYGTYGLLSTSITLHSDLDGNNKSGTIDGNTMTVLYPPQVRIYKKLN